MTVPLNNIFLMHVFICVENTRILLHLYGITNLEQETITAEPLLKKLAH